MSGSHGAGTRSRAALPAGLVVLLCVLGVWLPAQGDASPPAGEPAAPVAGADGPLPFYYDIYTFRGDAPGQTKVVAAFAVPVRRLEREERAGQVLYRFDVTLSLADTALRTIHRTDDSVFVASPRALEGGHLLSTHVEVEAPPSATTVQRVVMTDAATPGVGQLYDSAFPIPDYSGTDLMLSDIALGQRPARAGWRRGDVTLALLPTSQFPESSFDVYYEIYNLPFGHRYDTEIGVQRVGEGVEEAAGEPVRLRFSGKSTGSRDGFLQELHHVNASVERGRYRLTVIITDRETGATARSSRLFQVRGWDPGATMVAALPRASR